MGRAGIWLYDHLVGLGFLVLILLGLFLLLITIGTSRDNRDLAQQNRSLAQQNQDLLEDRDADHDLMLGAIDVLTGQLRSVGVEPAVTSEEVAEAVDARQRQRSMERFREQERGGAPSDTDRDSNGDEAAPPTTAPPPSPTTTTTTTTTILPPIPEPPIPEPPLPVDPHRWLPWVWPWGLMCLWRP